MLNKVLNKLYAMVFVACTSENYCK